MPREDTRGAVRGIGRIPAAGALDANNLCDSGARLAAHAQQSTSPLTRAAAVLDSSDEEPECPLCMESFDADDGNFFPCTCGYQVRPPPPRAIQAPLN